MARRSATPDPTALTELKWLFVTLAMRLARVVFAGSGRPPKNYGGYAVGLYAAAQDGIGTDYVLLPDKLIERAGAHSGGQRRVPVELLPSAVLEECHATQYT